MTQLVFNALMPKTVGERIRQARTALGMSALALAQQVGYRTQSGISNIENSGQGSGGRKIGKIAEALRVPSDWLLNGPDTDAPPFFTDRVMLQVQEQRANYTTGTVEWPFSKPRAQFDALPASERARIDGYISSVIELWISVVGNPSNGTHG